MKKTSKNSPWEATRLFGGIIIVLSILVSLYNNYIPSTGRFTNGYLFSLIFGVFFNYILFRSIAAFCVWIWRKLVFQNNKFNFSEQYNFYKPGDSISPLKPIITKVVGVTFGDRQRYVRSLKIGEKLILENEPNNPHDSQAVKVQSKDGQIIGYLNKNISKIVFDIFQGLVAIQYAQVLKVIGDEKKGQSLGVIIEFYIPSVAEMIASDRYY